MTDIQYPADVMEALRWAIQSQRALAFNLGYLDLPMVDEELPADLTWQVLSELHHTEYHLLNDFVIRRMVEGEQLTTEWTTKPTTPDEDSRNATRPRSCSRQVPGSCRFLNVQMRGDQTSRTQTNSQYPDHP